MPRVGFETTIPEFEWEKTVHASDRVLTATGMPDLKTEIPRMPEVPQPNLHITYVN
jgi:hypothetical protein